ncbi:MAG: tetratricopeptide repeat protein [Xanthobacteraceae bacterium]
MTGSRRACFGNLAIFAGVCSAILLTPADVQAQTLSEKLTRKIGEAQKAEIDRKFDDALSAYSEALQVDPDSLNLRQVLKMRARLFEQLEEYPRAENDLTAALKVDPPDLALYADRGYFYMRRARYSDAMTDFTTGARLDPTSPAFPFGVGRVETALGRHKRAIENYNRALYLDPRNARAFLARAESNVQLGLFGKARDDYGNALALPLERPQDRYFALLGRGYVAMMLGDLAAAVVDFDGALAIVPGSHRALAWRGYAYEKQGRRDLALSDYERAAASDPADSILRDNARRLRSE